MALSSGSLQSKIVSELQAQGFITEGDHAFAGKMAAAIAKAVIDEITANADVVVAAGSSAGTYKVS
ncbi:hypothetical protein CKQ84_22025 [Shewanella sp. WE21]|uniref:hypothetical protein n=1 Tax=Shewanella sp. WE21 TaxID=2029986 RepID=UPI000CF61ABD|nr:hypothetical protein [Shewanella sp. WE21]AVI68293.1 hypothetical protein CKQ84_22025 [Shewanella sp. WE21]